MNWKKVGGHGFALCGSHWRAQVAPCLVQNGSATKFCWWTDELEQTSSFACCRSGTFQSHQQLSIIGLDYGKHKCAYDHMRKKVHLIYYFNRFAPGPDWFFFFFFCQDHLPAVAGSRRETAHVFRVFRLAASLILDWHNIFSLEEAPTERGIFYHISYINIAKSNLSQN